MSRCCARSRRRSEGGVSPPFPVRTRSSPDAGRLLSGRRARLRWRAQPSERRFFSLMATYLERLRPPQSLRVTQVLVVQVCKSSRRQPTTVGMKCTVVVPSVGSLSPVVTRLDPPSQSPKILLVTASPHTMSRWSVENPTKCFRCKDIGHTTVHCQRPLSPIESSIRCTSPVPCGAASTE